MYRSFFFVVSDASPKARGPLNTHPRQQLLAHRTPPKSLEDLKNTKQLLQPTSLPNTLLTRKTHSATRTTLHQTHRTDARTSQREFPISQSKNEYNDGISPMPTHRHEPPSPRSRLIQVHFIHMSVFCCIIMTRTSIQ